MYRHFLRVFPVILISLASARLFAMGGTAVIATKGKPVVASANWPDGVEELVNDPTRTTGWNSWFSEWPNDVNQYAFETRTTDDINRLIKKLAAAKAEIREIRLSPLREPSGLGWVTRLPEGNHITVIFSIGDQDRIDEWYKHVRKPFGVMEFTAAPIAVPPTLTIFVQNDSVDLDELKIPAEITVTSGYVPAVFHRFNTKEEKQRENDRTKKKVSKVTKETLDPAAQKSADTIAAFLKKRNNTESRMPDKGAAVDDQN